MPPLLKGGAAQRRRDSTCSKNISPPSYVPSMDVGCHAIHGFSAETGCHAVHDASGIRNITYRQAHPAPSPILLLNISSYPPFTHSTPVKLSRPPPLAFPLLTLLLCVTFSAFSPYTVSSFLERRQRPWYNEK